MTRNFVRISLDQVPKIISVKAISDPSLDLRSPLKGPFDVLRDKTLKLEKEALLLLKSAQLLPAAIVSRVDNGENYATRHNLTYLQTEQLQKIKLSSEEIARFNQLREIPTDESRKDPISYISDPGISGEEHYAMEIGEN